MKNRIPPPIVLLITAGLMWLVSRSNFAYPVDILYPWIIGLSFAAVGVLIAFFAIREFNAVETTINPLEPASATALVDTGIFTVSRNPMYLGLLLILTGWGIWLGSLTGLAIIIVFVVAITELQIKPEEAALRSLFGDDYENYCQRVRRWI